MVQRDSGVADLFGVVTVLHRGVLGIDKNGLDIETNNKLNMEKEQDFFSKLVESFPKEYAGLVIVAAGALFFIGACRRWKWVPVSYTHLDVYKRQGLYCESIAIH